MKTMRSVCCLVLGAVACWSCGSSKGALEPPDGDAGGADGGTFAPDRDGGASSNGCSGDLRSVLDTEGNVVGACPPDKGCFGGQCIPACEAAAKSKGSLGCDFVVSTPSLLLDLNAQPCFAAFLANAWSRPAHVTVTFRGATLDATQFGRVPNGGTDARTWPALSASGLANDQVAVLFLSAETGARFGSTSLVCPVTPAVAARTAVVGLAHVSGPVTGVGDAFRISTDVPVSAYDIMPYGGANSVSPSAQLLLPTAAWGTNYIGATPPNQGAHPSGPQTMQIVAAEDGTTIELAPTASLAAAPGVAAAPASAVTRFSLNANQFIQWDAFSQEAQLSGSVVASDKPISFVGGARELCVSSATSRTVCGTGNAAHQQIPPLQALGSEYAVAPFATRLADLSAESIVYHVIGAVDGTTLAFDPPITGAPASIGRAQFADFETTKAFVVKSQDASHPFYVAQSMTGVPLVSATRAGATQYPFDLGSEEFVNVQPPAQFLSHYVFFSDPTYGVTNLVITRRKTKTGFKDVKVDCLGTIAGFEPLGTTGDYEYTRVDLVRVQPVGSCTNGRHVADSDGPFGVVVWGLDSLASYAYAAGGNVRALNAVVVPPSPK